MIVTVKPPGREEYALTLDGQPVFSSAIFGGYERAQIPCRLSDEERAEVRGGRLRVHGDAGIVWQGIVTRRPDLNEPLMAQGWGWCATLGRREALFCGTNLSDWYETGSTARARDIAVQVGTVRLEWVFQNSQSYASGDRNGFVTRIPATNGLRVVIDWSRYNQTDYYFLLQSGVDNLLSTGGDPWTWTTEWTQATGSGGTSGTQTVDITGTDITGLRLLCYAAGALSPGADTVNAAVVKVYGVSGVTSTTTANVIGNVLDNEIDTDYLPAGASYRAWIAAETTAIEPLDFDSCDASAKIAELTKHVAYDYGWYQELVSGQTACVPHWTARSATPDYVLRLDDPDVVSNDLDEAALDELVSAVRVRYRRADGVDTYVDVVDTDTTHPLVAAGITRYGDLDVNTISSSAATLFGQAYLADNGRAQVKGSVTTRRLLTSTGIEAYLPTVRPGRMVRVLGLPDGAVDAIIKRVECNGDTLARIELDNDPYALDIMLAQLSIGAWSQPRAVNYFRRVPRRVR